ncbi:hypothetical protein LJC39_01520 [Parabacteroides sp. OttesenSCG-928-B22]|nr:hypothetical protein [Parabacteroides sp. OttesenSCG-928-B22]
MRQLKIIKSACNESHESYESREPMPEFETIQEQRAWAKSEFEKRTGLKDGAKVRYRGNENKDHRTWNGRCSDPHDILDTDTVYEIEFIEIHRSFTIAKLIGFREMEFLGGIFIPVDKTEAKKWLKEGDTVRYIGRYNKTLLFDDAKAYDSLEYEGVYEVKSIVEDREYIGHQALKLVGFEGLLFNRLFFEKIIKSI